MQTVSVKPWPENELRTKIDGEVVFEKPRPVLWSLVRLRFLLTGGPATQRKTQAEDKKEAARAKHPAEPHLDGGGRCRETPQSKNL